MICVRALVASVVVTLALSAAACAAPTAEADQGSSAQDVVTEEIAFETFEDRGGSFGFRVHAANGALLLTSPPLATAADVDAAIEAVLKHGNDGRNVAIAEGREGFVFVLRTPSGELLGTSDPYASRAGADRGATTFRALIRVEQQARL